MPLTIRGHDSKEARTGAKTILNFLLEILPGEKLLSSADVPIADNLNEK